MCQSNIVSAPYYLYSYLFFSRLTTHDSRLTTHDFTTHLDHLESISVRIVILVDPYLVISINFCPAFNGWTNGRLSIDHSFFFYSSDKFTANDAFMNKFITYLQFSFCMPLRHSCTGARSAGRTIYGF